MPWHRRPHAGFGVDSTVNTSDIRILEILQSDGRITTADFADKLGLSPTVTGERVRRLTRDGVIAGCGARLEPRRLGLHLLVFVEVSLDKTTPEAFERFARAVRIAPEVLECHMVAGGFDDLVKARIADMAAYRRFLGEALLSLPGMRETRTYAVIEEVKADGPLPLRAGSRADRVT